MFKVTVQTPTKSFSKERLSDQQLLHLCQTYGSQAKLWKQKFLGLLPEVERRRLYEQSGCSSIVEFAGKLGGVSREQVQVALRLDHRFELMPELKQALVSGDISVNKLARVVSVATPQNQGFWLAQATHLSQAGLETLVRDSKSLRAQTFNSNKTATVEKVMQSSELSLNAEIKKRLLALQNKGLDLNQILNELLDQREERIQQEKQEIAQELDQKDQATWQNGVTAQLPRTTKIRSNKPGVHSGSPKSRYIPVKIKKIIKQDYGQKCAHSNCTNKSTTTHHTRRFALNTSHNPLYLAPLCKSHHEIAHAIDVKSILHRQKINSLY